MFVDVRTFGALAGSCTSYLTAGPRVAVSGRLELDEWKSDGKPRRRHKVIADEVEFLDAKPKESPSDGGRGERHR